MCVSHADRGLTPTLGRASVSERAPTCACVRKKSWVEQATKAEPLERVLLRCPCLGSHHASGSALPLARDRGALPSVCGSGVLQRLA